MGTSDLRWYDDNSDPRVSTDQILENLINVCIEHPHVRSLELQVSEIQHSLHAEIETALFAATGRELR